MIRRGLWQQIPVLRNEESAVIEFDTRKRYDRIGIKPHLEAVLKFEGAEGIILESVLEGMAEYYSADLAEKVTRGMTENALKCRFNGGNIPFGYMIDDEQRYQIDPTKAPLVVSCSAERANRCLLEIVLTSPMA